MQLNKIIELGYPAAWDCYHYRKYGAPGSDKQHHVLWTHIYTGEGKTAPTGDLMDHVKMYLEGTQSTSPGTVRPMVYFDDVVGIVNTVLKGAGCDGVVKINIDGDGMMVTHIELMRNESGSFRIGSDDVHYSCEVVK